MDLENPTTKYMNDKVFDWHGSPFVGGNNTQFRLEKSCPLKSRTSRKKYYICRSETGILPRQPIFLSYSRNDLEAAVALRAELEKTGFSVFRDQDAIRLGDRWLTKLQEVLQGCSAFVLLVGRYGIQRWIGAEVEVALIRNLSPHEPLQRLPIYPLLLPEGDIKDLPPFLSLFQIQQWQPDQALPQSMLDALRDKKDLLDQKVRIEGPPFLVSALFSVNTPIYSSDGVKKRCKRSP